MTAHYYQDDKVRLHHGDCLDVLATIPDASIDTVVTDPPYGLEFMGKGWDAPWAESDVNADAGFHGGGISQTKGLPSFTGSTNPKCLVCKGTRRGRRDGTAKVAVCLCADGGKFHNVRATEMRAFGAWCEQWVAECLRVLKPGGHLLAFGGTRTWHRLACAVEDAGFEIRDSIAWLYGSGFPKSLNLTDEQGERTGWGTALKPAFEPIVVARKPLAGTVAANVLEHGTGALNIDATRIHTPGSEAKAYTVKRMKPGATLEKTGGNWRPEDGTDLPWEAGREYQGQTTAGRWPTNVVLDDAQAEELDRQSGKLSSGANPTRRGSDKFREAYGDFKGQEECTPARGADTGGASRFFPTFRYEAKAPASERPRVGGIAHPTVKPLDLMRWLVRLVTPPGGTVLEPFAGSGTTVEACIVERVQCIAIEREADYLPLILARINRRTNPIEAIRQAGENLGLFELDGEVGA